MGTIQLTTTITSEEFEEDLDRAGNAAANGPVFITEGGVPAFVLLTFEEYRRISGNGETIADLFAYPEDAGIGFEPPPMGS